MSLEGLLNRVLVLVKVGWQDCKGSRYTVYKICTAYTVVYGAGGAQLLLETIVGLIYKKLFLISNHLTQKVSVYKPPYEMREKKICLQIKIGHEG